MNKKMQLTMAVREAIYKTMNWDTSIAIENHAKLSDMGIDSLKAITILFSLENTLGIEISNELIESCQTVDDIVSNVSIIMGETSNAN